MKLYRVNENYKVVVFIKLYRTNQLIWLSTFLYALASKNLLMKNGTELNQLIDTEQDRG